MSVTARLVTVCCFLLLPASLPVKVCPSHWLLFYNSCYVLIPDNVNWFDAREICRNNGATLVEIDSVEENNFMTNTMNTLEMSEAWIGLDDLDNKGHYLWSASKGVPRFARWLEDKPDPVTGQDCVQIVHDAGRGGNGRWKDRRCTDLLPAFCEAKSWEVARDDLDDYTPPNTAPPTERLTQEPEDGRGHVSPISLLATPPVDVQMEDGDNKTSLNKTPAAAPSDLNSDKEDDSTPWNSPLPISPVDFTYEGDSPLHGLPVHFQSEGDVSDTSPDSPLSSTPVVLQYESDDIDMSPDASLPGLPVDFPYEDVDTSPDPPLSVDKESEDGNSALSVNRAPLKSTVDVELRAGRDTAQAA